jgi:Ribonuclease G/E
MSTPIERLLETSVGETREALVQDGRAIALSVLRDSDEGARARWGEVYCARIREVDRRRRGAFAELGLSEDAGFLPLADDGRARLRRERVALRQGQGVIVTVAREAARGKNPVLTLLEIGHDGETPHRIAARDADDDVALAKPADATTRDKLDAAFDEALAKVVAIPGGGVLTIEPTAALVAIDVDAGARAGPADAERYAFELNCAAAAEAVRQVRLRNLGGLIAIDFVSMRSRSWMKQLEQAVRAAFGGDPWSVQFAPLSRFGVMELSRAQLCTPLHERLCDIDGRLSVESVALAALRAVERAARAQPGRQVACTLSAEVKAWLDSGRIDWRAQLSNRIGMRWNIEAPAAGAYWPRDKIDVRAL